MTLKTTYQADSLEAIAVDFEERAQTAEEARKTTLHTASLAALGAEANTWRLAANILRRTTIVTSILLLSVLSACETPTEHAARLEGERIEGVLQQRQQLIDGRQAILDAEMARARERLAQPAPPPVAYDPTMAPWMQGLEPDIAAWHRAHPYGYTQEMRLRDCLNSTARFDLSASCSGLQLRQ